MPVKNHTRTLSKKGAEAIRTLFLFYKSIISNGSLYFTQGQGVTYD
jgi:hypothetical protein